MTEEQRLVLAQRQVEYMKAVIRSRAPEQLERWDLATLIAVFNVVEPKDVAPFDQWCAKMKFEKVEEPHENEVNKELNQRQAEQFVKALKQEGRLFGIPVIIEEIENA